MEWDSCVWVQPGEMARLRYKASLWGKDASQLHARCTPGQTHPHHFLSMPSHPYSLYPILIPCIPTQAVTHLVSHAISCPNGGAHKGAGPTEAGRARQGGVVGKGSGTRTYCGDSLSLLFIALMA